MRKRTARTTRINYKILKQLNALGVVTILLIASLIILEIVDFALLSTIQATYVISSDKAMFDHLKRLFVIGAFFIYSISHFRYISKKYPALATTMNRRILATIQTLTILFVAIVILRLFFLFSVDFPQIRVTSFSEFSRQRAKNFTVLKNPAAEYYDTDYVVMGADLIEVLTAEQEVKTTETAYCLYGNKLVPRGSSRQETEDDLVVIEGVTEVGVVTATENMLRYNPCSPLVLRSELSHLSQFKYPGREDLRREAALPLVGLVHTHPPVPQNNIFQLRPPECELASQDVFTFARENLAKRAWVWGLACSNKKLFFYSTGNVNVPINLVIVE